MRVGGGQGVGDPRRDARDGGRAEVEVAVAWSSVEAVVAQSLLKSAVS